jgi:hypothetical protein
MGRWAEVYFTSLPENRDQAVTDLLNELGEEVKARENGALSDPLSADPEVSAEHSADLSALLLRCPDCGYENRADHNFCGACRTQLRGEAGAYPHLDPYVDSARPDSAILGLPNHDSPLHEASFDNARFNGASVNDAPVKASDPTQSTLREVPPFEPEGSSRTRVRNSEIDWDRSELLKRKPSSDVQRSDVQRNDRQKSDAESADLFRFSSVEQTSGSYRVYAGLLIAVVIAFLLYRAWAGGHAGAGISHTAPQLPPPEPAQTSQSSTQSTKGGAAAASTASPANAQPAEPADATTSASNADRSDGALNTSARSKTDSGPKSAPHHSAAPESSTEASVGKTDTADSKPSGNGSAELTLAKSYLNGTDGKPRNTVAAAVLLWKAVSKQNAEATDLLSDLYLKGDGVSKNCDQARILLDAAARKGRKDAGERLGHLQAFGCQ